MARMVYSVEKSAWVEGGGCRLSCRRGLRWGVRKGRGMEGGMGWGLGRTCGLGWNGWGGGSLVLDTWDLEIWIWGWCWGLAGYCTVLGYEVAARAWEVSKVGRVDVLVVDGLAG